SGARAGRAGVRVAGVDLDAVAVGALRRGGPLALCSAVVGDAAADLVLLGRSPPARVRRARGGAGRRPALVLALVGVPVLALHAVIVRQAARHLLRNVVAEHVLPLVVGHFEVLAARIRPERLLARPGPAAETRAALAARVRRERPEAHATEPDAEP